MTEGHGPIFVVGLPRSGTTLLSAMLAAHSRLDCGPETRLLDRLRSLPPTESARLLDEGSWPGPATEFLDRLHERGADSLETFGLTREEVATWLAARRPSVSAMLESLVVPHARRAGKARWVEKTPRHLLSLDAIRKLWPEAAVVRIVRDPRDVAVSLLGVPFGEDSLVGNLVRIDYDDRVSRHFFKRDEGSMTLRYEDLVSRPEQELRRLCRFLGEEFEVAMLDGQASAGQVTAQHEWWKASVRGGLDTSRVGRWRTQMRPDIQRFAALHLARFIAEHGYEDGRKPQRRVALVPIGGAVTERSEALLLHLAERDMVTVRPSPRRAREIMSHQDVVFCGVRGQLDPLRNGGRAERALEVARLASPLLFRRLRGRPVLWVRRRSRRERRPTDPCEIAIAAQLRLFARTVEPEAVASVVTSR